MITSEKLILVFLSAPDIDIANKLADTLLEERAAACVSILPGLNSRYRWKGVLEKSEELLVVAKTRSSRFKELEQIVLRIHPYETPEIIALPASAALEAYAQWVFDETKTNSPER